MQEEIDKLSVVMNTYKQLQGHYNASGEIDQEILAELRDEIEQFEGSEDDVTQLDIAVNQLLVNESDAESSASARGQLFQLVTNAVKTFASKQRFVQRVGEEAYTRGCQYVIEQVKESHSTEQRTVSPQLAQYNAQQHEQHGSNGETFIKNVNNNCKT